MLGHVLYNTLINNNKFELIDLSYRKKLHDNTILCDVSQIDELEKIIYKESPKIIINCIGVLLKEADKLKSNTIFINAYLPHKLSEFANKINAKLIQISTDCVFDGKRGCYSETDLPNPIDIYGKSKAVGEVTFDKHLTLRTSIIGAEIKENGQGLFHWFLNQKNTVKGYSNVYWGGVTTIQLGRVIEKSIELELQGLVHVTNGIRISKYDLLKHLNNYFNDNKLEIIKFETKSSDKSLVSKYNYFDNLITDYEKMILEMKEYIMENKNYYNYII